MHSKIARGAETQSNRCLESEILPHEKSQVVATAYSPMRQPCLYPQLFGPKARKRVIIPQRSCLTTQPVVAQRTTGRFLNQPTQTLKGFHNSAVCRTPSAFIDNPLPNPGCAARPGALLLKSFGLGFTPQKSKMLGSKLWVKTRLTPKARVVSPLRGCLFDAAISIFIRCVNTRYHTISLAKDSFNDA